MIDGYSSGEMINEMMSRRRNVSETWAEIGHCLLEKSSEKENDDLEKLRKIISTSLAEFLNGYWKLLIRGIRLGCLDN